MQSEIFFRCSSLFKEKYIEHGYNSFPYMFLNVYLLDLSRQIFWEKARISFYLSGSISDKKSSVLWTFSNTPNTTSP
jgi:hypothetical protein